MHENLTITDGVYGILSEKDVREQIAALSQANYKGNNDDVKELISIARKLVNKLSES